MATDHREQLSRIRTFPSLVKYLRDELDWPITQDSFEEDDNLFYDFTPEELGLDAKTAAKIQEIKRLRPLSAKQPWGIFFIKFEPKKLPVVALRRLLGQVALKKRASANSAERTAWSADDLLFVSNYGEGDTRQISFAHFSQHAAKKDLPTLKVLGWDNLDTALHLDRVAELLNERLAWPENEDDAAAWRRQWCSAFTLRHREVIDTSKKLSVELAALARNIRDRINTVLAIETEDGPVSKLMAAFKEALVHDLDEDGFADMYAQTIAYGLLSARVASPSGDTADDFVGAMPVTNPFLKELMETFIAVGGRSGTAGEGPGLDFDELGVGDVVELLDAANMKAVVLDFGDKNPQEDPVIHFYELFLKEYDAEKRMQRGVFYTPRPVVSCIVRAIDEELRAEYGLVDGLADTTSWGAMADRISDLEIPDGVASDQPFVQVLDPATGTGTFLVEIIDLIFSTMTEKWKAEGDRPGTIARKWNAYVASDLLPRIHGYELMMAPYAIAHMKLGLKLHETGYLFESHERARVYLTNALEPAQDFSETLAFAIPALAHEAEAVSAIKQSQRFTVVLGNPPYSLISANMGPQHRSLVERYKTIESEPLRERGALQLEKILNDDYVKFIAMAEAEILRAGVGVLGFITNHAYLDNPTMRGLRYSILKSFQRGFFLDLGGSTKKSTGEPDENVFEIQQGVAICLLLRGATLSESEGQLCHARISGRQQSKYDALASLSVAGTAWDELRPTSPYYLFVPTDYALSDEYSRFMPLSEAFDVHSIGCFTSKDHFVISRDADVLVENAMRFRDSSLPDDELCSSLGINAKAAWNVGKSRAQLKGMSDDQIAAQVVSFTHRPFDRKVMFYDRSLVWSMAHPVNRNLIREGNLALVTSRQLAAPPWCHAFCADHVVEMFLMSNKTKEGNHVFPLWLMPEGDSEQRSLGDDERRPNLTRAFLKPLARRLGLRLNVHGLPDGISAEEIFHYVYAICFSPSYRSRYADFLKIEFPRIPLPGGSDLFHGLSAEGEKLAALHLMRWSELRTAELAVGVGPMQVEKVSYSDETVWIDKAKTRGFKGVPEEVWNFHIGAYQVCKKWLKDRQARGGKKPRSGHVLTDEDVRQYGSIVAAVGDTIRVMGQVDEIVEASGGWPGAFQENSAEERDDLAMVAESEQFYGD